MNLNKVFLLGRLTADPQLRSTPTGQSVASFSLATNRFWTDKNGQKQDATEFHNIVAWGKLGETASKFLIKGSLTFIEGRMQTRNWEDKQGQQRRITEIVAETLQLGPRPGGATGNSAGNWKKNSEAAQTPAVNELPVVDVAAEEGGGNEKDLPF